MAEAVEPVETRPRETPVHHQTRRVRFLLIYGRPVQSEAPLVSLPGTSRVCWDEARWEQLNTDNASAGWRQDNGASSIKSGVVSLE